MASLTIHRSYRTMYRTCLLAYALKYCGIYYIYRTGEVRSKTNPARLINNAEWLTSISLVDFLRDVGKHFTVNYMLAKESVRRRYEEGDGISFTEFSYMLLQAYDFLVLHDRYGCTLQMGGSDQWGNIVAGTELIRKMRATRSYGMVFPLLTTTAGIKC